MAREKFRTLTEQMFYILLCLKEEQCGVDIMKMVSEMTDGEINIGPGTMYTLLENFSSERLIMVTRVENRKKSYIITSKGKEMLEREYERISKQKRDYETLINGGNGDE